MLKRLFTGITIAAIMAVLLSATSLAATDYIQGFDVTVNGSSASTFFPDGGQTALASFTLDQTADIYAIAWDASFQIVATFADYVPTAAGTVPYTWYGTVGNVSGGTPLADGTYQVLVYARVGGVIVDFGYKDMTIDSSGVTAFTLNSFTATASGGGNFDPAPSGDFETMDLSYSLSQTADSVAVIIKDSDGKSLKTFSATNSSSDIFVWDGEYVANLVDPGTYTVEFSAIKSGYSSIADTEYITVEYNSSDKPTITNFSVSPDSFDPDFEDTEIKFTNSKSADIVVEIQNSDGTEVRDFSGYERDNYVSGESHTVVWNGENNSSSDVSVGTYVVYVRVSNNYGVSTVTSNVSVDDSLGDIDNSNSHIGGISFSPSSNFEPAVDDELEIEFDVKKDLDELQIYAVRGSTEIELYDESNVDEEDNVQVFWDGTDDDDEYAADGTWTIIFRSKEGSTDLEAGKVIDIDYEKPQIDDLLLSKEKFDNDLGEFTYVIFRVDVDAEVDIFVMEGGDEDDDIIEGLEVEGDKWYAVEWDGGSYDYDNDLDIKVVAKNIANDNVYDSDTVSVDLAEDEVSSSKSNVTEDYVSPVLTDGTEYMSLFYDLEEDADVVITIHKGTSTSGAEQIELLDIDNQDGGSHEILWDGKDDDGDKLAKGVYTYKIVSKLSSTETESGHFVVGEVGDIDGGATGSSSDDSNSNNVPDNVIVDGNENTGGTSSGVSCAGYTDVTVSSPYCDAIEWTTNERIFLGYSDNTFQPNDPINRVELLKVVLEAYNASILTDDGTNMGFIDVIVGSWYMPYIRTGKTLGVFHGDVGYYTARPGDTVNRAEALKIIFETLDAQRGYNLGFCTDNYEDVPSYAWYYDYACEANKYSLFVGSSLFPSLKSTRGEIAELLYKLHNAGAI
ncbi:MAG: FlgD immunoglobulin-like domain containing protein [Nitrospirota bacterium]